MAQLFSLGVIRLMIAYDNFSKLRLRVFCPGDDLYSDERDEHGELICESIRGIYFARPVALPDQTFLIEVDLLDYSTDVGPEILATLGIPFTRNSTSQQVFQMLGQPHTSTRHEPDDYLALLSDRYEFRVAPGYDISITFLEPGGRNVLPCYQVSCRSLWGARIARCDLEAIVREPTDSAHDNT